MFWTKGDKINNENYIIEGRLGKGAFGVTHKARHTHLDIFQVIKNTNIYEHKDRGYEKYVNWFKREGQILAKISQKLHPHIVQVKHLFSEPTVEGDVWCLVMDFIDGDNLSQLIEKQKVLTPKQAINYIQQIGSALTMIHEEFGLAHRDLHPGNIMLPDPQNVILIDFGLAREVVPHENSSMTVNSKGHPNFIPYEQFKGMQGCRDPKVDIYSVAATLYFLVTGQYPTSSENRKTLGQELILPHQHQPHLSKDLEEAILWGMELEAKDRPSSIREWLGAFAGDTDDLSSERGIDYTRLRDLLKAGQWKEADIETGNKMLEVMGRTKEGWLGEEDINNLPCVDLRTIDQLWVKASQGRFGFSVQKKIWLECGGKVDIETERKLGDRVKWRENGEWKGYRSMTFDLTAPPGHLPRGGGGVAWVGGWFGWDWVWVWWGGYLFSRAKTCKL